MSLTPVGEVSSPDRTPSTCDDQDFSMQKFTGDGLIDSGENRRIRPSSRRIRL
jgi:hypothetical protein